MIGSSAKMRELFALIERVAPSDANILVQGEHGTGKELVARAIHRYSRRSGPFVAVNCAALSEDEHRATLETFIQQFGDVLTSGEARDVLAACTRVASNV